MATVTSVNVNGLRDRVNMTQLLYTLRNDILCVQETNWDESKVVEWGKSGQEMFIIIMLR